MERSEQNETLQKMGGVWTPVNWRPISETDSGGKEMGFDASKRPRFRWNQDMPSKDKGVQRLAQTRIHSSLTVVKEALLRYASDWHHLLILELSDAVRHLRHSPYVARISVSQFHGTLELYELRAWTRVKTSRLEQHANHRFLHPQYLRHRRR